MEYHSTFQIGFDTRRADKLLIGIALKEDQPHEFVPLRDFTYNPR